MLKISRALRTHNRCFLYRWLQCYYYPCLAISFHLVYRLQVDEVLPVDAEKLLRIEHMLQGIQVMIHGVAAPLECTCKSCLVLAVAISNILNGKRFDMLAEADDKTLLEIRL